MTRSKSSRHRLSDRTPGITGKVFPAMLGMILLMIIGCDRKENRNDLTWSIVDSEYEGYPLRVEKPVYPNIYEHREKYPRLLRITLKFDSVMTNGWPNPDYEIALTGFDKYMRGLFNVQDEGVIFLIETFGGQRAYHYFISDLVDYNMTFAKIQNRYPTMSLVPATKMNSNWEFLNEYPTNLY